MGTPTEVYGWKDIARLMGRTDRWARKKAGRNRDPLPVRVGHRGVYADVAALRAWADRQDMSYTTHSELRRLRAILSVPDGVPIAEE